MEKFLQSWWTKVTATIVVGLIITLVTAMETYQFTAAQVAMKDHDVVSSLSKRAEKRDKEEIAATIRQELQTYYLEQIARKLGVDPPPRR